jgi:glycosyl transferase family 4
MRTISILFTNNALATRAGSEMYIRDVALALLRRGHCPTAFSLVLGRTADELRRATVPVVDDLARLGSPPDVIHGHHHLETLIAALTFPETPIVHFCHGWVPWEEMPLRHPSVARYIAVDEVCLDRLVREEGIAPDSVEVLHNFVDLDRFRPRAPLPPSPRRALVFGNHATADGYTRIIGAACAAAGIALEIVGAAYGNPTDAPEALLQDFDLVFAKGRAALEALTVGCAVILADAAGGGPLVTPANFDRLRSRNFGIRELQNPHDAAWYEREIGGYSADNAACVSARARAVAGLEPAVDRLLAIYGAAIAGRHQTAGASQAAARHLARIARPLKDAYNLSIVARDLTRDLALSRSERDAETIVARDLARDLALARREREAETLVLADAVARAAREEQVRAQLDASEERAKRLDADLAAYRSLPTLRLRDALLRVPVLGRLLQTGARRCAHALDRRRPTAQ